MRSKLLCFNSGIVVTSDPNALADESGHWYHRKRFLSPYRILSEFSDSRGRQWLLCHRGAVMEHTLDSFFTKNA